MPKIINNESFLMYFFEEPNKWFHVREMGRLLKLNPTTASKHLSQLCKESILIKKYERRHLLFRANTESYSYKDAKVYHNLKSIRESGVLEYLDEQLHYPESIAVFGSYSKGENDSNSDIDLLVISNVKKELNLEAFEKKLKAKIQLLTKSMKEFKLLQKESMNLANNILNGIVIKGYLEVFK